LALEQWSGLKRAIEAQTEWSSFRRTRLPDQVFTANAGMVLKEKVVVSRFRSPERQGEEPFFREWFAKQNFDIAAWPPDIPFEGAGDALLDRASPFFGLGMVSFRQNYARIAGENFQPPGIGLQLVDPRFYHLDTCLCRWKVGI